jgi:hypothetical protein
MKKFLSLFSVLTFVLLSLVVTTSMAAPSDSHQSQYQSIQPLAVVAVTFEVFTPSVLNPCPVNLIDTYIETDLKPVIAGDTGNIFITYFYLPTNQLTGNYFAPCLRKTITNNLS